MSSILQEEFSLWKAQSFEKFAFLNLVVGIQILEIVNGLPGVLSLRSIHNGLLDKKSIYLLLMQLPSQVRKVKFTAQWPTS